MATGVRIVLSEHADYSLTVSSLVKHTSHLANRFYLAIHYHVSITLSGRNASMSQQLAYDRNVATRSEYHCGKGMSGGMKCNRLVNACRFHNTLQCTTKPSLVWQVEYLSICLFRWKEHHCGFAQRYSNLLACLLLPQFGIRKS